MKILHIDTGTAWRGGQRQVLTLHRGLIYRGVDSVLICNFHGELYKKCGNLKQETYDGFEFTGIFSKATRQQIEHLVLTHQPDLIHCHDSHSVALGSRYHNLLPIFHTRRVSYPIKWLSRALKYRNIHQHICVSNDIQHYMSQYFTNTTTIHSCIDLNRFKHTPSTSILKQPKEKNLLYVGAFTNQKGVDILLQAFSNITSYQEDTKLHLVGDGELLHSMKELAIELNIDQRTEFYGARNDVEDFYLACDAIICPSVSGEGSSGVIKEGMAAGKPVVASDLIANKELIDHNVNGILFSNSDVESLAHALQRILTAEKLPSPKAIKDKISQFDCHNTIQQHIGLYQNVITN